MRVRPLLCSVPVLAESLRREVSILESSQGSSAFDLCENSTAESLHGAAAKDEESASKSRTVSLSCSAAASARQSRRQSRSSFRESMSNALAVALSPPASPPQSPSSTIDGQPVETIGQSRRGSAAPTTSNLRSLRMMPKMATTRNLRHFAQQNGEEDDLKCSTLRRPEDVRRARLKRLPDTFSTQGVTISTQHCVLEYVCSLHCFRCCTVLGWAPAHRSHHGGQ